MATGTPGTNGVWQYGEDDSEATFSALLNKAAGTTDTQIGLDRARLTTLEARKLSGVVPIIPSSVSVASGSGSHNTTTGLVTFSGATGISINGVFTSAYTNYEVLIYNMTCSVANTAIKLRLRQSGSDSTGLYYQTGFSNAGSVGSYNISNGTYWDLYAVPNGVTYGSTSAQIFAPQVVQRTSGNFTTLGYNSAVGTAMGGLLHDSASTYDGFSIVSLSAATFTGNIKIFGWN